MIRHLAISRSVVPWLAGIALGCWYLLVAATLGLEPLSSGEANLLQAVASGQPVWRASPLGALMTHLVLEAGPPLDTIHRLAGLLLTAVGALGGYVLCSAWAQSKRAGWLAAACLSTHGAILVGSMKIGVLALSWGAQCALALVALTAARHKHWGWNLALAASGATAVLVEPLALLAVGVYSVWLAWRRGNRQGAVLLVAAAAAALMGVALAGLLPIPGPPPVPNLNAMAAQILGIGLGSGSVEPHHPLLSTAAPAAALAVLGVAVFGIIKIPGQAYPGAIGLLLPALASALLRPEDVCAGPCGWALIPPTLVLAALGADTVTRRVDSAFWLCLLLGLCLATGGWAVATYRHDETRSAAQRLSSRDRVVVQDAGLGRAVAFYRGLPPRTGTRPVRLWRPGDRQPRRVAVHAFGEPLGRLWIVRRGTPSYDLGHNLHRAEVTYTERNQRVICPWQGDRSRFFCGGPEYHHVSRGSSVFADFESEAIFVHPLDDGVTELRWRDIPLGQNLVGVAGLDDGSLNYSTSEVVLEVAFGGGPPVEVRRGDRRGLLPFRVARSITGTRSQTGDVVLRVTAPDDRNRHLFFDALTVP